MGIGKHPLGVEIWIDDAIADLEKYNEQIDLIVVGSMWYHALVERGRIKHGRYDGIRVVLDTEVRPDACDYYTEV